MPEQMEELLKSAQDPILPLLVRQPGRIDIHGDQKSLESLIEEFAGLWEISERNSVHYRESWKHYLPKITLDGDGNPVVMNKEWCVAYDPIVAVRKCHPTMHKACLLKDLGYFIVILNTARDQRPRQDLPIAVDIKDEKDPLQRNLIDKGMIISTFGDFYLCPNGYPYHRYASLLIAKSAHRRQECPQPADIEAWIKFSILMKQFIFFNSPGAGASIPARMHAQVVDPAGIRAEDQEVLYPLLNDKITRRRTVRKGIEVLEGYGIEALVLRGRDAPHLASLAVKKLREEHGHAYNIMIKEKEVFIVARNPNKETSHCIGKKVGAYEMSGVILVGNIEEPLLEQLDLNRVVSGADIFTQLSYEQISGNIENATAGLGGIEAKL
jgi:hypothetical protein